MNMRKVSFILLAVSYIAQSPSGWGNGTGTYAEYQGTISKDDIRRIVIKMIAIATSGRRIPICQLMITAHDFRLEPPPVKH